MKSLVFFSGRYRLDELGAIIVNTRILFPGPSRDLDGAIIGMRHFVHPEQAAPALTQVDLWPRYLRASAPYRAISKACRKTFPAHSISLGVQKWVDDRLDMLADKMAAQQATALFRENPDIEIALGFNAFSLAFGRAAKAAGKRYVVKSQWSHPLAQNALLAEGYKSLGLVAPLPVSKRRLRRQIAELELADLIWCPSRFVQQSLVDNGVPRRKTFVVHNGVDVESFRVPPDARRAEGPFQILFVGSVIIRKGIHVLLDALMQADLPDTTLILNGKADAIVEKMLEEYRPRLAEKGVSFRMDPGDPRRYHKTASLLALPSLEDSFGNVVPEAMAAGLPVIVSDHVGASEIVEHGKNGFIFESNNAGQLAEYLVNFRRDRDMLVRFGDESRRLAVEYDVRLVNKKLLSKIAALEPS